MPNDDDRSAADRPAPRRRALTAALGNATALGLGFFYLRRWEAFGLNLFVTAVIGVVVWRSEPPAGIWFVIAALIAAATALAAWRAARRADWEVEDEDRLPWLRTSAPFGGRFWLPVFAAVLAGYAVVVGWFVVDAHRVFNAQTEAHRDGDCRAAYAMTEDVGWGHQTFATGRFDAVHEQAETCDLYLTAQTTEEYYTAERLRLARVIQYLEWYSERSGAHLRDQVAIEIEQARSDLVMVQLSDYDFDSSRIHQDIAALQQIVEADPDSPLAERASAELDAVIAQWEKDIADEETVCQVSGLFETLFPVAEMPEVFAEPGPIADPLMEAREALGGTAALGCAEVTVDRAESSAADDPERSERLTERAVELLERVGHLDPDGDTEAGAAARELLGLYAD